MIRATPRPLAALALMLATVPASLPAQAPAAKPALISPEVAADGRVTFRLEAPLAQSAALEGDFLPPTVKRLPFTRGQDGIWTLTTDPLPADYYSYDLIVDGVTMPDPSNGEIKPGVRATQSTFLAPGAQAALVTPANVPHGEIRQLFYTSPVTHSLRRLHVYLPPDYETSRKTYPVVYLFHGGGDNDTAWTTIGRVNIMLDNLIAQGKALPMIVVMPDLWAMQAPVDAAANVTLFRQDLLQAIIPFAQSHLRIAPGARNRAVGGLGIGRAMLPEVVWPMLDQFGTVFFASGGADADHVTKLQKQWPGALDKPGLTRQTRFFLGDGAKDASLPDSLYLAGQLQAHGFAVTTAQSETAHGWPAFRHAFASFAATAFKGATTPSMPPAGAPRE